MKLNSDFQLEWTGYHGYPAASTATHGDYHFILSPSGFAVIVTVLKDGKKIGQAVRATDDEAKEYCRKVVIRGV